MVERRLAAILALDVVGYSRLMQEDELATLVAMRALKDQTLTPAFSRFGGRVFKEMGDGLLVEFSSVVDAVACAVEIQGVGGPSAIGDANADADTAPSKTPRLPVRIGVHFGDVIVENDDLFGDGVNVAARLEARAPVGGIAISGAVHSLVRRRLPVSFHDGGKQSLKNISEPVQVFHVVPGEGGAEGARAESTSKRRGFKAVLALCLVTTAAACVWYLATSGLSPQSTRVQADAALAGGLSHAKTFRDCDTCPVMVAVAGGWLRMGAPADDIAAGIYPAEQGPQRMVAIRPFALGKFEVTKAEFERYLAATGKERPSGCRTWEDGVAGFRDDRSFDNPGYRQANDHPAVCISWQNAQNYADWLSRETGKPYRLPSEAEWEYAARGGRDSRYHFGEDTADICRYDNTADAVARSRWPGWLTAECSDGVLFTAPVGKFQPNPFGLHDMYGNAREWVKDCWHPNYLNGPSDSTAWVSGGNCQQRVVRGGSWDSKPEITGSTWRGRLSAVHRDFLYGFRIARDLGQ
jgi:formylglycine-generating enzyme required for sulfatase activity/class 3 adenylate cyclase